MSDTNDKSCALDLLAKLTKKERDFVLALRKCGKQGQAAREAGYSDKSADVTASRLMSREDINAALAALYAEDCKSLCITTDSVILTAKTILDRCMQAEPVMKYNPETKEWEESGVFTFDSKGAARALQIIASVGGLERKKVEVENSKPFELNIVTDK